MWLLQVELQNCTLVLASHPHSFVWSRSLLLRAAPASRPMLRVVLLQLRRHLFGDMRP